MPRKITHKYPFKNVRSTRKHPNLTDYVKKGRYNSYVIYMYIIVSSEVLYKLASMGPKAHNLIPKPHISLPKAHFQVLLT